MKGSANRDAFLRMNFLYQAAHTTLVQNPDNTQVARFYIATLKTVAKRLVLRIHPHMKRTICKRCDLLLIPGVTATVRVRARREQHTVLTCLECKRVKRFTSRDDYKLWVEQPESQQAADSKKQQSRQKQFNKKPNTSQQDSRKLDKLVETQPSCSGKGSDQQRAVIVPKKS
ncbi:ribonuclease P protein subunit p21-like [Amphiura filiformis]|uniref:ribonuclease P protein subunit p21-like n=1 Tax=Amphiura filiformis TaxID=82378 RepID=UPI003B21E891